MCVDVIIGIPVFEWLKGQIKHIEEETNVRLLPNQNLIHMNSLCFSVLQPHNQLKRLDWSHDFCLRE